MAQGMELVISDDCKDMLAKDGYNPTYGARPLRRSIQRYLEDALAEQVLQGKFKEGDTIETVLDGDAIRFDKSTKKPVKADKTEKADKIEKPDKTETPEKAEKPEKSGEEAAVKS